MLPNHFGTRIISENASRPFGTRIISANAPKSIWNTYSKRKCKAARRPASQPASQPASRHKNLDFRGCPGSLAKPTQIDPLGALLGPGEQFSILNFVGGSSVYFKINMFAWPPGSSTAAPQAWARGAAPAGRGPARPDNTSRPLPDQLRSQPARQLVFSLFDQPAS